MEDRCVMCVNAVVTTNGAGEKALEEGAWYEQGTSSLLVPGTSTK
jgi:hypothetical protein